MSIPALDHGFSPRPEWAGTCPRCLAPAGTNCALMTNFRCRDPQPLRWRVWWRVYTSILAAMRLFPVAEWRREGWSQRIDFWGMDHFGDRQP